MRKNRWKKIIDNKNKEIIKFTQKYAQNMKKLYFSLLKSKKNIK